MKKILSVLLVLAILLGCMLSMTACGNEEETGNTTEATTEGTPGATEDTTAGTEATTDGTEATTDGTEATTDGTEATTDGTEATTGDKTTTPTSATKAPTKATTATKAPTKATTATKAPTQTTQKKYALNEVAAAAEKMKFTGSGMQTGYCPKCNATVAWSEITDTSAFLIGAAGGGHYYLSKNVKRGTTLYAYNGPACIFFNGYTLTYDASVTGHESNPAIGAKTGNDVNLMGKGGITTKKNPCGMTNDGVINIFGGTYNNLDDSVGEELGIQLCFTFRPNNPNGAINVYGGTFTGGFQLPAMFSDAKIYISGKVVMDDLISQGGKITFGTLSKGSKIGVSAKGEFTTAFASADAANKAAAYMTANDEAYKISVSGKTISCVEK